MGKYRKDRVNGEIMREMTEIFRSVKDPRVSDNFVSVTAVDCTADLKYAKIYYSHLMGEEKEVAEGLKTANGFLRRELANRLNLRITPELTFIKDTSIAYGAHIEKVLKELNIQPEGKEEEHSDGTEQ